MKFFSLFILIFLTLFLASYFYKLQIKRKQVLSVQDKSGYWFVLKRKSNIENLYYGSAGDEDITYLYKLLDPKKGEIRYYIDNI